MRAVFAGRLLDSRRAGTREFNRGWLGRLCFTGWLVLYSRGASSRKFCSRSQSVAFCFTGRLMLYSRGTCARKHGSSGPSVDLSLTGRLMLYSREARSSDEAETGCTRLMKASVACAAEGGGE